ncbi:MAG: epimerase [bacterium]|nr:epimerase [bacterium]
MKIILYGATGMVGQGVLRECLQDPEVEQILLLSRRSTNNSHPKVRELLVSDFMEYATIESDLVGYDACFFCLGVSSVGMSEQEYYRITFDLTMAAAQTLIKLNPNMTFVYLSGTGADSSETGKVMWARVKGKVENALFRLPFKGVYVIRPGYIQPLHGIKSRTSLYNWLYFVGKPLYPLLKNIFPTAVTTTENIGLALLQVAKQGTPKKILENRDINQLSQMIQR